MGCWQDLYFWSISAQLKTVVDRLFAICDHHDYEMPVKECVLLMTAESSEKTAFDQAVSYYERNMIQYFKWADKGRALAGGMNGKGDVVNSPVYEAAKEMGRRI